MEPVIDHGTWLVAKVAALAVYSGVSGRIRLTVRIVASVPAVLHPLS